MKAVANSALCSLCLLCEPGGLIHITTESHRVDTELHRGGLRWLFTKNNFMFHFKTN